MDLSLLIKQRLGDLGLGQRDLAAAAQVTESYVSQLLNRKKAPPNPARTDLYDRIGTFLRLPAGELSRLVENQRLEELKKKTAEPLEPLFGASRALILSKCNREKRNETAAIFEKQRFGELERLVTQKLLDVTQEVAGEEFRNEAWLRAMAKAGNRTYEQMRVAILEFLDMDIFNISVEGCASFLEPMIDFWDIDLRTFALEIGLNRRLAPQIGKRFEFAEIQPAPKSAEPGLEQFLKDTALSGDITDDEIDFLRSLKLGGRRPNPLYYYRELQNLRDPVHFQPEGQLRRRQ